MGDVNLAVGVSSLASVDANGEIDERRLEIWWYDFDSQPGDTVAIFLHQTGQPSECQLANAILVESIKVELNQTWARANTSLPNLSYEQLSQMDRCVMYWVAYLRQGQILACNCLRTQPNWMWELRDQIGTQLLRQVFLPGTHDAAAYEMYRGSSSNNIATKYAIAQGENLLVQLHYGVRYLDMRIMYRPATEARFWTCHGSYVLRPLLNDTALIKQFMRDSKDIVIFDIHGLENMDQESEAHDELHELLFQEFGEWMAPAELDWNATLDDFWTMDKRLIVTYNENVTLTPYLWDAVRHKWGNVQSLDDLETYLESVMVNATAGEFQFPWSAMAELTPSSGDVLVDRFNGLRGAADIVNRNVTLWFRDRWTSAAAIVASDFFLGTNIVDIAIRENQRRTSGNN